MKKWFENLKNKSIVHIIMGIILIIVLYATPSEGTLGTICSFIFFILFIMEIVFIAWHVNYNKSKRNTNQIDKNINTNEQYPSINNDTANKIETIAFCPETLELDDKIYHLEYHYKETLCFVENMDEIKLNYPVKFRLNEKNEFDENTVEVIINDKVIGLMYNDDCRDIIIKCLKHNKFYIDAYVVRKDKKNEDIKILVGFYEIPNENNSLVAQLIKTSKKDILSDRKRLEMLEYVSKGEEVTLSEDSDVEGLLVQDDCGNELGELSESIANKILENTNKDLEDIKAYIEAIECDDNGKNRVKIRIFY